MERSRWHRGGRGGGEMLEENELAFWETAFHQARYSGITATSRLGSMGLVLIEEVRRLRGMVEGLADRVAAQSELLSKRAEEPLGRGSHDDDAGGFVACCFGRTG